MNLIFAGTPPFAAAALSALCAAGHRIAMVLTQPDRPAGRGMKMVASAVAEEATQRGLPLRQPKSLKDAAVAEQLREVNADAMVVAAYGLILPAAVLALPRFGCFNIHGSILPRWRGAAPVQRAIEAGDTETGVTIMQMDEGLDTGPVLLEKRIAITPDETTGSLFQKLTPLGAATIVEALELLPTLNPQPQPANGATYAKKIEKSEAVIRWSESAMAIERRLRAFDPSPGCETMFNGEPLKIWRAQVVGGRSSVEPGSVIVADKNTMTVQCGNGAITLTVVQKHGGKRMPIADFLRGTTIPHGVVFA